MLRFLSTPRLRSAALPFAANGVLYGTWAARIPEIQTRTGLSEGTLGLALLGAAVGLVIAASMAGALVARFGAHRVTLVSLLLYGVAVVGPGVATGFASLAGLLVLVGLTSGLLDVAMNAWGAEVEASSGVTILGACHGMFSLGAMIGAGIGAGAAALDLPLAAHLSGTSLVVAGLAFAQGARVREPVAIEVDDGGPLVALPLGPVAGLAVLAFAGLVVEGAMADWSAVYLREVLAASESAAALGLATFSACMAAARFGSDAATSRFGDRQLVAAGGLLGAVGLATCLAAPTLALAVVGFGLVGLGFAAVIPSLFRAASRVPGLAPGMGIAAVTSAGYFGLLAGPPLIGFIAEAAGLRASFGLLVAFALVISLGASSAFRHARPSLAADA